MVKKTVLLSVIFFCVVCMLSCANHFGSSEITKPDEHKKIYEAKEKYIAFVEELKAADKK